MEMAVRGGGRDVHAARRSGERCVLPSRTRCFPRYRKRQTYTVLDEGPLCTRVFLADCALRTRRGCHIRMDAYVRECVPGTLSVATQVWSHPFFRTAGTGTILRGMALGPLQLESRPGLLRARDIRLFRRLSADRRGNGCLAPAALGSIHVDYLSNTQLQGHQLL